MPLYEVLPGVESPCPTFRSGKRGGAQPGAAWCQPGCCHPGEQPLPRGTVLQPSTDPLHRRDGLAASIPVPLCPIPPLALKQEPS